MCYRGLKLDEENISMKTLLEKIQKRSRVKEEQDRKRRAERERIRQEHVTLARVLKARKIKVRGHSKTPDMADAILRLVPDPLSDESRLEFPTMMLYPMHNQSDFIKAFSEQDAILGHLDYLLPLPWDDKKEYTEKSVSCYMDTTTGGIIKLGKKVPLREILAQDKVEVVDGLVRIYVVPQSLAPTWIEQLKSKKGK